MWLPRFVCATVPYNAKCLEPTVIVWAYINKPHHVWISIGVSNNQKEISKNDLPGRPSHLFCEGWDGGTMYLRVCRDINPPFPQVIKCPQKSLLKYGHFKHPLCLPAFTEVSVCSRRRCKKINWVLDASRGCGGREEAWTGQSKETIPLIYD